MKLAKIIVLSVISMISVSCNMRKEKNKKSIQSSNKIIHKEKKDWSYEGNTGPEHWDEFEKDSDCGGRYQSPINIISKDVITHNSLNDLDIHYVSKTKIHEVVNNGHSIQYNFEPGDYISFKGDKYELKQIHFHESSEHTIDGIRYPMAIHMVHVNDKSQIIVLAVMVKEGNNSAPFEFLESYLPINKNEHKTINSSFDLNQNLPNDKGYYHYVGSLTTPPCTEGVNWFIFKNPITISLEQVKIIQKLMPINNYRNEQPLNGRQVNQNK